MRKHLEDDLQVLVADYLRRQYPQLLWFAVPNGGKRNKREGARFKRMGVRAGVADILLFWREGKAAIELKVGKNGQQDTQKLFEQQWIHTGGQYQVCRSLEEVMKAMREWRVAA